MRKPYVSVWTAIAPREKVLVAGTIVVALFLLPEDGRAAGILLSAALAVSVLSVLLRKQLIRKEWLTQPGWGMLGLAGLAVMVFGIQVLLEQDASFLVGLVFGGVTDTGIAMQLYGNKYGRKTRR